MDARCTGGPRTASSGKSSPPHCRGADAVAPRPSSAIGGQFTERPLGADRPRWYVPEADPFPGTRGRTERETAPARPARRVEGTGTCRGRRRGRSRILHRRRDRRTGRRRRGGHCAAVEPCGEHPASGRAPLHVHPGRRHQHGVHRLGAAQHQLRQVARRARPDGPAERLRERPGAHAAVDHCRRGTGRPRSVAVRRPRSCSRHSGADRRAGQRRPGRSCRLRRQRWGSELRSRLHATRSRLRLDVRRRLRRHQPRLHLADRWRVLGSPGQHPGPLDDHGQPDGPDGRRGHDARASTPRSS